MKPMGRRAYNNKSGGKHHVKIEGKFSAWWTDMISPNKTREKLLAKKLMEKEIEDVQDI